MPIRVPDPIPDESWVVTIKGRFGPQRTAQTYELSRASLELSDSMAELSDWMRSPDMLRPTVKAFVLKGLTTGGTIEMLPETTGELNAFLREKDAAVRHLTEENERLRAAVRRLGDRLSLLES